MSADRRKFVPALGLSWMHPSYIPEYPGSKLLIAFSGRLGRCVQSAYRPTVYEVPSVPARASEPELDLGQHGSPHQVAEDVLLDG